MQPNWLQRMDRKLGAWLYRKFPKLAGAPQEQGFNAGASFGAELEIKVIRKHETKNNDTQNPRIRTFWNRLGTKW